MLKSFDDVFEDVTKFGTKIKTDEYQPSGKYQIIDQGQAVIAGYTDLEDGVFENVPAIIFGDHTRTVKYIDKPFFLGADGVKVLRCRFEDADYRYLYYALKNVKIPNTGYNRHFKWLKEAKINYPNTKIRSEIVSILDGVLSIIERRQQQLQKLDELVKAKFIEMFGGINNSNKYPFKLVKELTNVISGGTPSRDVGEYWNNGTIPWVKTTELKNNVIVEVEEYITEKGLNNSSAKTVPPGTVLIAMYGQGKTRGMTAYLSIEACTNQACACVLPSDKINQTYLWQFLVFSYNNLRDMAKGGNQPNLNGNVIKNYPILYPPRELQEQFAAFVEQVNKSKAAVQKALDEAQLLFDSLMQKYFG